MKGESAQLLPQGLQLKFGRFIRWIPLITLQNNCDCLIYRVNIFY